MKIHKLDFYTRRKKCVPTIGSQLTQHVKKFLYKVNFARCLSDILITVDMFMAFFKNFLPNPKYFAKFNYTQKKLFL